MDRTVFENEEYAAEARERWGGTEAYREFERRGGADKAEELMGLFKEFGAIRGEAPESPAAQAAVSRLQAFITQNFYTCTDGILKGLGEMYVSDERFKENIDRAGGEGTAEFVRAAIRAKAQ